MSRHCLISISMFCFHWDLTHVISNAYLQTYSLSRHWIGLSHFHFAKANTCSSFTSRPETPGRNYWSCKDMYFFFLVYEFWWVDILWALFLMVTHICAPGVTQGQNSKRCVNVGGMPWLCMIRRCLHVDCLLGGLESNTQPREAWESYHINFRTKGVHSHSF